jgi:queuine tRNA-ribosyltransferase
MHGFTLQHTDPNSSARAGQIETDHGPIQTPIFMPVGTVGTVKAVEQDSLRDRINAQIILGNTYHLYLRPGMEVIEQAGGLHKFMGWDRPMLTDSGGYQVYSLASQRKLTEEGAAFSSHIDGSKHLFTPEKVVDIQRSIGSNIMMVLDECPPGNCEYKYAEESLALTMRWTDRAIKHFKNTEHRYEHRQALFPIVQGASFRDLRTRACEEVAARDMPGNAIGGLSVGEPAEVMYEMTELCCSILPKGKPRYLMGVGTPENLLEAISLGVDMFDCVMPTRNARHGLIFTSEGIRNMKNEKYSKDFSPLDPYSDLATSQQYTKAYVRHLFKANEYLGLMLTSMHNLHFYLWLVSEARKHIIEGDFVEWKKGMIPKITRRL